MAGYPNKPTVAFTTGRRSTPSPRGGGSGGRPVAAHPRGHGGGRPRTSTGPIGSSANPNAAISDALAGIASAYDEELARLRGSGGGGGVDMSGYNSAIAEAAERLRDVQANRSAIKGVYKDYHEFLDPLFAEAIGAASSMVAENAPKLDAIHATGKGDITGAFDEAEQTVLDEAALIGAGAGAGADVVADTIDGEALRIAAEMEEAITAKSLLGLQAEAGRTQAVADRDLDKDEMTRRARLIDIDFETMEDAARDQLQAAQRAAAAARARASAMRRQRAAAIAELEGERARAMRLNPHEAGEATALRYLGEKVGNMDYNRQQLLLSTVSNAISEQVPAQHINRWAAENDLPLSTPERRLVSGAVVAYTTGMRVQQSKDGGRSTYTWQRQ